MKRPTSRPMSSERPEFGRYAPSGDRPTQRVDGRAPHVEGEGDQGGHDVVRQIQQHHADPNLHDDQHLQQRLSDALDAHRLARLRCAERQGQRHDGHQQERRRPRLCPEQHEDAGRAAEEDPGQHQVADGAPAGPPLEPKLEVGHRPQEDGDDRHQQQAQAARDEAAEERRGDAGRRRNGVARQAEVASGPAR